MEKRPWTPVENSILEKMLRNKERLKVTLNDPKKRAKVVEGIMYCGKIKECEAYRENVAERIVEKIMKA